VNAGLALAILIAAPPDPRPAPLDLAALAAPSFEGFSAREGLPDSVLTTVQTDREGFVWAGSPKGLLRYDGHRWHPLGDPRLQDYVENLFLDHEGTLWASFREAGLAWYDGRAFRREEGFPTEHLRRVTEIARGEGPPELWALTFDRGALRREGGAWVQAPASDGLPRGVYAVVRTLKLGGHERLWAATGNDGVWYLEDGAWRRFRTATFDPSQVEDLLVTEDAGGEELWIATFGVGLARLNGSGLTTWSVESGDLPTNQLYDLVQTTLPSGGRIVWVASRAGLIRIYLDQARVLDRRYGLPDVVRGLSAWRAPNGTEVLWLATEAGISRTLVGSNEWQTASVMGSRGIGVFGVFVERGPSGRERLWLASTKDGVGLYEAGRWREFTPKNSALRDSDVRFVKRVRDARGTPELWAGLSRGYLYRVREGPVFEEVGTPWPNTPSQAVMDTLSREVEGHHEQWFATRLGLYRRRDGAWKAFQPEGAHGDLDVVRLAEQVDARGRSWLWATTNEGLLRFDGDTWRLLGAELALPDVELKGLTLLPEGRARTILWIGTVHAGIVRVDVTDPAAPALLPGGGLPPPPDPTAYSATPDAKGRIYVCTNSGVQLLTPLSSGYDSRVFTRRDGMIHDECNTNAQLVDPENRFWTGTLGGVTVFDPDHEIRDRSPKPLRFLGATIDGAPAPSGPLRIPPGAHDLRIEFGLLSWHREGESRFRTELVGYEGAPGPWTALNGRDFNGLPAGQYVLRIEAQDYAQNPSAPLEVGIEVLPGWWQRPLTRALVALAAVVGALGFVRLRTRGLEAQRRHLEQQVAERTAELHDANARLLDLSYRDALTGLANRRRLLETLERAIGSTLALIFVDVDHFKDYNDHFGHPAGDEALRGVAEAMRACAALPGALVARYGGEEFACIVPALALEAARDLAERIRAAVAERPVPVPGTATTNHVTISAGVARRTLGGDADVHALLREADAALYAAKGDGRNCVRSAPEAPA
jgi:diguanylate cyclase (GGDEF)-like protein